MNSIVIRKIRSTTFNGKAANAIHRSGRSRRKGKENLPNLRNLWKDPARNGTAEKYKARLITLHLGLGCRFFTE